MSRREVSPLLKAIRNLWRGSQVIESLRFRPDLATRDPPMPQVPGGPHHALSKVYYFSRDARREVLPPINIVSQKQIAAEKSAETAPRALTPGKVYLYGQHDFGKTE